MSKGSLGFAFVVGERYVAGFIRRSQILPKTSGEGISLGLIIIRRWQET
jgi:hypothetical protein